MGWASALLLTLAALALVLFAAWRWALASNAVSLLDWADRAIAGTSGTAIALAGGTYGDQAGQRIEVIVPSGPGPHPVIVFIHGGAWNSGAPGEYHFVGRTFARKGYVVVLPGYRLTPQGRFPHMLEDSALALRWVKDKVARFGGDPEQVFVMGHSAGAYNAAMLALDRQWLARTGVPQHFIKATVGLAGPYDFYPFTTDSAREAFGHVADPTRTQPIHFVRNDASPMLLLHGDADETVKPRNSIALARALNVAGQPTRAVLLKDIDHAGIVMKLAAPFDRDQRVRDAILAFLAEQRSRKTAPSAGIQATGGIE